ncbi:hypothetical protein GCM10009768_25030 [Leucobacter iarius]|uniref:Uncharacterized protein n=2 Tax=Leucobacter iarius TaxID=333963 RepID=A0ABN2LNY8_9MICO
MAGAVVPPAPAATGYREPMRVLVIGRGPVAHSLLSVLPEGIDTWAGLRSGADRLDVAIAPARRDGHGAAHRRSIPAIEVAGGDDPPAGSVRWDAVLTTAPPHAEDLGRVLASSPDALLAGVSQAPSDVIALRAAAAGRRWGLLVPEFLATRERPVRWWGPLGLGFAVAGSAAPGLRALIGVGARTRRTGVHALLEQAALVIPVVAGFRIGGETWSGMLAEVPGIAAASVQARAAVSSLRRSPGSPFPAAAEVAALRSGLAVALRAAPAIAPVDLEVYMRSHFGHHTEQTLRMLDEWRAIGSAGGLPVDAITTLRDRFAATLGG